MLCLLLGLGFPAYSQFIFVECLHSRHPDVCKLLRLKFKVPNSAVAMDAWALLACYPQRNFYRVISGGI
jgi:hypothetical protein